MSGRALLSVRAQTLGRTPGVSVLRLEWPGPRQWGERHRSRFIAALQAAAAKPRSRMIVLSGPRLFDEDPFAVAGNGDIDPLLAEIATCPIPVIAAIPGPARGSGLELALACAGRVASPQATFSLPGVHQAQLPRPETLARLPRLIGVPQAAALITLGTSIEAAAALALGLVDGLTEDDVVQAASRILPLAAGLPAFADELTIQADLFGARRMLRREAAGQAAPLAAFYALDAALRVPRRRLAAEVARLEADLGRSEEASALRHTAAGLAALQRQRDDEDPTLKALADTLRWPMLREAIHLIDEGATPAQVDRCLEAYGFAEGPFRQADRVGLATVFSDVPGSAPGEQAWICYSATLDLMLDAGRLGGAQAPGWYRQGEGVARFDAAVEQLIGTSAVCQRLHRAPVPDETVVERCLLAALHASASAVESQPGLTEAAIDAVWVSRLGFPRWKGGPVHQATQLGLRNLAVAMTRLRGPRDTLGPPCDLLCGHMERDAAPARRSREAQQLRA